MTAPAVPPPGADHDTSSERIRDLLAIAQGEQVASIRRNIETNVAVNRAMGAPSSRETQDAAYLFALVGSLTSMLSSLLASRDALAARETRVRTAVESEISNARRNFTDSDMEDGLHTEGWVEAMEQVQMWFAADAPAATSTEGTT